MNTIRPDHMDTTDSRGENSNSLKEERIAKKYHLIDEKLGQSCQSAEGLLRSYGFSSMGELTALYLYVHKKGHMHWIDPIRKYACSRECYDQDPSQIHREVIEKVIFPAVPQKSIDENLQPDQILKFDFLMGYYLHTKQFDLAVSELFMFFQRDKNKTKCLEFLLLGKNIPPEAIVRFLAEDSSNMKEKVNFAISLLSFSPNLEDPKWFLALGQTAMRVTSVPQATKLLERIVLFPYPVNTNKHENGYKKICPEEKKRALSLAKDLNPFYEACYSHIEYPQNILGTYIFNHCLRSLIKNHHSIKELDPFLDIWLDYLYNTERYLKYLHIFGLIFIEQFKAADNVNEYRLLLNILSFLRERYHSYLIREAVLTSQPNPRLHREILENPAKRRLLEERLITEEQREFYSNHFKIKPLIRSYDPAPAGKIKIDIALKSVEKLLYDGRIEVMEFVNNEISNESDASILPLLISINHPQVHACVDQILETASSLPPSRSAFFFFNILRTLKNSTEARVIASTEIPPNFDRVMQIVKKYENDLCKQEENEFIKYIATNQEHKDALKAILLNLLKSKRKDCAEFVYKFCSSLDSDISSLMSQADLRVILLTASLLVNKPVLNLKENFGLITTVFEILGEHFFEQNPEMFELCFENSKSDLEERVRSNFSAEQSNLKTFEKAFLLGW
jgi:hypothetical protein